MNIKAKHIKVMGGTSGKKEIADGLAKGGWREAVATAENPKRKTEAQKI